jgi:hypothetical protein
MIPATEEGKIILPPPFKMPALHNPEDNVGLVQGKQPDSKEEWWISQALDHYKIPYIFQYEIFGGHVRGGLILDFLVLTQPLSTPLEYDGGHWHEGQLGSEDRMRQIIIDRHFGGSVNPLKVFYEKDIPSRDDAFSMVRSELL